VDLYLFFFALKGVPPLPVNGFKSRVLIFIFYQNLMFCWLATCRQPGKLKKQPATWYKRLQHPEK